MLKNYFKIAFRNLSRNKVFSAINIVGLSIGLTCCLLMVLYMQHELSYDKFHANSTRIARVIMEYNFSGEEPTKGNFTSTKVLPSLKRNFPEVVGGVRMSNTQRLVKYGDKLFLEKRFAYADSTFFDVFSFRLLSGKPTDVLMAPRQVVLTQSTAKKYFGDENPVGKVLLLGSTQENYLVTGVMEDIPSNSQVKFDFLASFSSLGATQERTYFDANYTTYLLLRDEYAIVSLQSKIPAFMKKELIDQPGVNINYELEPLTKVHLFSPYDGFEPNSNITYIYIIAGIALLVLIIACFTYINLSTARSVERAKEVGIRKVSGAHRKQLFWQFITESVVISMSAFVLSIILAIFMLPAFNRIAEKELTITSLTGFTVPGIALGITLIIAVLAGSYPALIMSGFKPVSVLKGAFRNTASGVGLRRSLIVFQFMISVFLITATIIIQQQLRYIQHKKLGYDREHVIVMNIDQKVMQKIDLLKDKLKADRNILAVSKASYSPVNIPGVYGVYLQGSDEDRALTVKANPIDEEFIRASGLEIIAGTDLDKHDMEAIAHDENDKNYYHFVLNETAAAKLGWTPADAIGKKIFLGSARPGEVKAVVKDFHFASLHNPVEPLVLFPDVWATTLLVKTSGQHIGQTLSFMEDTWKALAPHRPFEYHFMDEDYDKLYSSEYRTGKVFNIFAAIAIVLASLGLFGLSAFSARQRIKEIGIRKVMGASAGQITLMLSGSFIKLVIIAFVLASPISWWAMNKWLQDFAYRIDIGWLVFAIAGMVALGIAWITVSIESIRSARANPVRSLRTE